MHRTCVMPHRKRPEPVGAGGPLGRPSAVAEGQICEIPFRDVRTGHPPEPCYINDCASLNCTYLVTGDNAVAARVRLGLAKALAIHRKGFGFFV